MEFIQRNYILVPRVRYSKYKELWIVCQNGKFIQSLQIVFGLLFYILDKTAEMRWIKAVDVSSRQLAPSATDKPTTESLDHTP